MLEWCSNNNHIYIYLVWREVHLVPLGRTHTSTTTLLYSRRDWDTYTHTHTHGGEEGCSMPPQNNDNATQNLLWLFLLARGEKNTSNPRIYNTKSHGCVLHSLVWRGGASSSMRIFLGGTYYYTHPYWPLMLLVGPLWRQGMMSRLWIHTDILNERVVM